MNNHEFKSEEERLAGFQMLRKEMHSQSERDLEKREIENPHPTEEDLKLGTFIEAIEPQVRDAVLAFTKKGYQTTGSGFDVAKHDQQSIYGTRLNLSNDERHAIEIAGAKIRDLSGGHSIETHINLTTSSPNTSEIVQAWKMITDALPARSPMTKDQWYWNPYFIEKYAPERIDLLKIGWRQVAESLENQLRWYQSKQNYQGAVNEITKHLDTSRKKLAAIE